ncbi:endoplasmic reticulum mannosyl-oligosaccharide 1,2-alpha-mannosidase isoform X2 [Nilaparvata lugens]|uniref:endoplasmic reticulum mannosyl-oligosaccharide 1,2-alpha-mannosidase isoform X2 n=1 Tax=Nilaparvata lugens TaxID=108931 RepID=UPI00193C99A5|nr:endoplasmic reticulum mannosyl-oligosaccharide 1,2-alpha-mannosidase isoform X2 [Nilaparvata lugens]
MTDNIGFSFGRDPVIISSTPRRSLWRSWKQLSRFQRNLMSMVTAIGIVTIIYYWSVLKLGVEPLVEIEKNGLASEPAPVLSNEEHHPQADAQIAQPDHPQDNENNAVMEDWVGQVAPPEDPPNRGVEFPPPSTDRQKAVVDAFMHAWNGYRKFAWGHDHLKPVSGSFKDWFHLGLSITDSLDTIYIMGLKEEFEEAKGWVRDSLKFNTYHEVNLFEVTIRVLGGLLSAYHLSGDRMFLEKATDLGERLLPCFTKSPSGIPYSDINLASQSAHSPKWSPDSSTSEVTTLQLEFRDLSRSTHESKFEDAAFKVSESVHNLPKTDGLVPIFINPNTGQFHSYTDIKLGARGDSYYEYLLKQWIQTGKTIDFLKDDYLEAVEGIKKWLVRRTPKSDLVFIGELKGGTHDFVPKMDHLVCYLPGTLALGYHNGLPEDHLKLALDLMETCYQTYAQRPTFLAPEISFFSFQEGGNVKEDIYVKSNDAHNLLRPEFIESLWYLYQITGNTTYQDWGWNIFKAFEKYTKVAHGFTSIGNVNNVRDTKPRDMMESFFLSETIKYLYLLFSNDRKLLDIDKYVINSEAHPLPIHES